MKGIIINDWAKVDPNNARDRQVVCEALKRFMAAPASPAFQNAFKAKVAEFATAGDFPEALVRLLEKFNVTTQYDDGWRLFFDFRDFTTSAESGFDLLDVTSGLTFEKVPTGQKARVYGMSGSKVRVYFDSYGAGLMWDRKLLDDRQWWALEDSAVQFRNKAYASLAANHYALVEAVSSGRNIAWQAVTPAGVTTADPLYNAIRDANTLNAAAADILTRVKDKGYGVTPQNATFVVLVPLAIAGRIRQAMGLTLQAVSGSPFNVAYNFTIVPTLMLSSSTSYYVILPRQKIKSGMRMDLSLFGSFDALAYADLTAGWMRYGATIGDQEQIARCAIS